MSDSADLQELYQRLLEASRTAFASIQQLHPDENFYAFSLFHEPLWGYIIPTCNTEEGLNRAALEYKLDKRNLGFAKQNIEELAVRLRWSPPDWVYHAAGVKYFDSVNNWLTQNDFYRRYTDDEAKQEEIDERIKSRCRKVLKTLDAEGLFGMGDRRIKIVLNIMMGDQDSSWLEHAHLLNPYEVYERWIGELKAAKLLS